MNAARNLLVILAILAAAQGCTLCDGWCPLGCRAPACPWDNCPTAAPEYAVPPPAAMDAALPGAGAVR